MALVFPGVGSGVFVFFIPLFILFMLIVHGVSDVDVLSTNSLNSVHRETFAFHAEVPRLLDLLIHSVYSSRDIYMRELLSNAADALDKERYLDLHERGHQNQHESQHDNQIQHDNQLQHEQKTPLEIRVNYVPESRTLHIRDTGIGMSKKDMIERLGGLASSGTAHFLDEMRKTQQQNDAAVDQHHNAPLTLIGQFGIGFYAAFLVADRVDVSSVFRGSAEQYKWSSTAHEGYTIEAEEETLGRGTLITLHVKDDAIQMMEEDAIIKDIKKFSEFIDYPIYFKKTKKDVQPIDETEQAELEEEQGEEEESDRQQSDPEQKKEEQVEWVLVNDVKAIWTRDPKEVSEDEYNAFYRSLAKDRTEPLAHVHFKAEGEITFKSILYVPNKAPTGFYEKLFEKGRSLKLYVRRVLVSEEVEDFLPRYLSFMRGVVDSDDLPLNVNRETLSQNKMLKVISKKVTRKTLELFKRMSDDAREARKLSAAGEEVSLKEGEMRADEKYDKFFDEFGKAIKLGIIDDHTNKAKLVKLLRFQSSKSDGKLISIDEYVERMKENQAYIYYITGESLEAVQSSPFVERLLKKDLEVIFMVDPIDEYLMHTVTEYEGHQFASVTKENLKLDDNDKQRLSALKKEFEDLTEWLQESYGDRVEKVVVSNRIAESPVVLVTGQYGWSANMERIMRAQAFGSTHESAQYMISRKTMEINPYHPVIKSLRERVIADASDPALKDVADLLYDAALLTSGFQMSDPKDFAARVDRIVRHELDVDLSAVADEEPEFFPDSFDSSQDNDNVDNPSDFDIDDLLRNINKDEGHDTDDDHDEL